MSKDEALRLALETLEDIFGKNKVDVPAITAIKQALEQPEPEILGWATHHDEPMLFPTRKEALLYCEDDEEPRPLYTSPPKREPEQEPVAWQYSFTHSSAIGHGEYDIGPLITDKKDVAFGVGCFGQVSLYTSPPKREWQGLTGEERYDILSKSTNKNKAAARVEAKLKEKNT